MQRDFRSVFVACRGTRSKLALICTEVDGELGVLLGHRPQGDLLRCMSPLLMLWAAPPPSACLRSIAIHRILNARISTRHMHAKSGDGMRFKTSLDHEDLMLGAAVFICGLVLIAVILIDH
jgi:hypothetical protein